MRGSPREHSAARPCARCASLLRDLDDLRIEHNIALTESVKIEDRLAAAQAAAMLATDLIECIGDGGDPLAFLDRLAAVLDGRHPFESSEVYTMAHTLRAQLRQAGAR